jgi:hypothetical protein
MTKVITFEHRGVRAAIPAAQVRDVSARSQTSHGEETLWVGRRETGDRFLRVTAHDGDTWLRCVSVELVELSQQALLPLSAVLRDALKLPHVVGVAEISGESTWLVDMNRFKPRSL